MTEKENILRALSEVRTRIFRTCHTIGRDPEEIQLLLATKTVPIEKIAYTLEAGEVLIGENKLQELKAKHDALTIYSPKFHFIGHLQTNKIKDVLKYADCIQAVDRLDLAQKLDQRLKAEGRSIDIFVQINTSYEESKFGMDPSNALEFVKQVAEFETLRIKGLMTIGLFTTETNKVRKCFRLLKNIQQQVISLNIPNVEMKELSMGMSNDLEIAIEEGATIIRVGTAIFGQRIYPDSYYWNENMDIQKK